MRGATQIGRMKLRLSPTRAPRSLPPLPASRLKWRARTLSALSIQSAICTMMLIVLLYALCPHVSGADSEFRRYCAAPPFVYETFVLNNVLVYLPSMALQIQCLRRCHFINSR